MLLYLKSKSIKYKGIIEMQACLTDNRLRIVNNMLGEISDIYQKLLMSQNVPEGVFIVMSSILELGEGCLQKEIVREGYINKKTVNSTIKKLEKEGLIQLQAGKYPNMHIYLTDEGKQYMEEHILPIIDLESRVLDKMSSKEFETLVDSYKIYIDNFRENVEEFSIRSKS